MAELSFGEKLLIARKQLDLYQYQMAERLGVHANSLTKYERGEGKPHAAVVRMFELLCEQQGIRFDEYELFWQRRFLRQHWPCLRPSRDGKF
jgi:D-3-phosphoglycerate dehydrogenase